MQFKCSRRRAWHTRGASVSIYCAWVIIPLFADKEKPHNFCLFNDVQSIDDVEFVTTYNRRFLVKCCPLVTLGLVNAHCLQLLLIVLLHHLVQMWILRFSLKNYIGRVKITVNLNIVTYFWDQEHVRHICNGYLSELQMSDTFTHIPPELQSNNGSSSGHDKLRL